MGVPGISVTATCTGLKPRRRASSVAACPLARAAGTMNEYFPASDVIAPSPSPTSATDAPCIG